MITLTAFRWVPPFAQGLVRDFRVRWALEEAGIPYRERLIGPEDLATAGYRALQPFGQVPAIETDNLKLFESGAIVLHITEQSEALAPSDVNGRARTSAWMFAALNSAEPPIQVLAELDLFHAGEAWAMARRPMALAAVQKRLGAVEDWLGGRDYLEDRFTAGDLLMTTVLRILRHTDIVSERPALKADRSTLGLRSLHLTQRPRLIATLFHCDCGDTYLQAGSGFAGAVLIAGQASKQGCQSALRPGRCWRVRV